MTPWQKWYQKAKKDPARRARWSANRKKYRKKVSKTEHFKRLQRAHATRLWIKRRDEKKWREQNYARIRRYLDRHPELAAKAVANALKWQRKNPEKVKAHRIVRRAIFRGQLKRPKRCSRCHVIPPRARDGRTRIQAHHKNYAKPLEVTWLCAKCHGKESRIYQ